MADFILVLYVPNLVRLHGSHLESLESNPKK